MHAATVAVVAVFGLLIGSFTNVLIARVPAGRDWVHGSSACPKCGHEIAWYDNIPVLSWLALRAKCRNCHEPISGRYPLVELLVAGLFVGAYVTAGLSLFGLALGYLACVTVALAFIDIDTQRLPNAIVVPSAAVVGILLVADAAVTGGWSSLGRAAAGAGIVGGFYFLMWLVYPKGMGFGDVKTAALLGLPLGYIGWGAIAVGAIAGPLLGGVVVAVGLATRRIGRKSKVPYGPALIAGVWVGILAGQAIATWYTDILR